MVNSSAALWPKETYSTSLERSKPLLLTYFLFKSLAALLRYFISSQSTLISKVQFSKGVVFIAHSCIVYLYFHFKKCFDWIRKNESNSRKKAIEIWIRFQVTKTIVGNDFISCSLIKVKVKCHIIFFNYTHKHFYFALLGLIYLGSIHKWRHLREGGRCALKWRYRVIFKVCSGEERG